MTTTTMGQARPATSLASWSRDRAHTTAGTAEEAAVREVYLAHFGQLAGWATHLVGDPDHGHDMATDAFVRLLDHWHRVDQPRPWLYATVGNLVKDHWRRRGRESNAYRRFQGGLDPDVDTGHHADPAETLSVRGAVESLPERLRMAVLLHYFADLTVAEVARQLGKAEGTIKRDLHEARARLATTLESAR